MKASVWSPQPQEFPLSILCWFPAGQGNCQPGAASATFLESPKADTSATATVMAPIECVAALISHLEAIDNRVKRLLVRRSLCECSEHNVAMGTVYSRNGNRPNHAARVRRIVVGDNLSGWKTAQACRFSPARSTCTDSLGVSNIDIHLHRLRRVVAWLAPLHAVERVNAHTQAIAWNVVASAIREPITWISETKGRASLGWLLRMQHPAVRDCWRRRSRIR